MDPLPYTEEDVLAIAEAEAADNPYYPWTPRLMTTA